VQDVSQIREDIVTIGKKMVNEGLVAGTWGNISARVPNTTHIAITPSGMGYLDLVAEDIVIVDLHGNSIDSKRKPSSEMKLHLTIYKHRPDVHAIVHTHSVYASACAVASKPIPPMIEDLVQIVGGGVDIAAYALPGTQEVADNAVKALAKKFAVLLESHGIVGVGANLQDALKVCQLVEKSAQIFINAQILGGATILSNDDVQLMHKYYKEKYGQK
jgi:ribulose-5-phosphate 4-epimerase/fuculose-1-phosphate aldolase